MVTDFLILKIAFFALIIQRTVGVINIATVAKSCLDHLKCGSKENGFYTVVDGTGNGYTVYCDFTSEPGTAWTLVLAWAFANKDMPAFRTKPFTSDSPVNENTPNMNAYRLTKKRMGVLKSVSSHWRATCNFPSAQIYKDYVRASFDDFDIMNFNGYGICKKVEFVNIRKHTASHTMVQVWQAEKTYNVHIDSSASSCEFKPNSGSVSSEDNFGFYHNTNPKFGCTSSPNSVTQYWFGAYV